MRLHHSTSSVSVLSLLLHTPVWSPSLDPINCRPPDSHSPRKGPSTVPHGIKSNIVCWPQSPGASAIPSATQPRAAPRTSQWSTRSLSEDAAPMNADSACVQKRQVPGTPGGRSVCEARSGIAPRQTGSATHRRRWCEQHRCTGKGLQLLHARAVKGAPVLKRWRMTACMRHVLH